MEQNQAIQWYSTKDIAKIFSVSPNTVRSWLCRKQMPRPDISGNRFTRWKEQTIRPFLDNPLAWRNQQAGV